MTDPAPVNIEGFIAPHVPSKPKPKKPTKCSACGRRIRSAIKPPDYLIINSDTRQAICQLCFMEWAEMVDSEVLENEWSNRRDLMIRIINFRRRREEQLEKLRWQSTEEIDTQILDSTIAPDWLLQSLEYNLKRSEPWNASYPLPVAPGSKSKAEYKFSFTGPVENRKKYVRADRVRVTKQTEAGEWAIR